MAPTFNPHILKTYLSPDLEGRRYSRNSRSIPRYPPRGNGLFSNNKEVAFIFFGSLERHYDRVSLNYSRHVCFINFCDLCEEINKSKQ